MKKSSTLYFKKGVSQFSESAYILAPEGSLVHESLYVYNYVLLPTIP